MLTSLKMTQTGSSSLSHRALHCCIAIKLSQCRNLYEYPCHSLKLLASTTSLLYILIIFFQLFYSQQVTEQFQVKSVISIGPVGYYRGVEEWHQVMLFHPLWPSAP